MQVLAIPANLSEKGEAFCISTHTSDMIELISGVCKVPSTLTLFDMALYPMQLLSLQGQSPLSQTSSSNHLKSGQHVDSDFNAGL